MSKESLSHNIILQNEIDVPLSVNIPGTTTRSVLSSRLIRPLPSQIHLLPSQVKQNRDSPLVFTVEVAKRHVQKQNLNVTLCLRVKTGFCTCVLGLRLASLSLFLFVWSDISTL